MRKREANIADELRPEYDLAQLPKSGVKGKYAQRYHAGTNLVLIEPKIRQVFKTDQDVNDALRLVIELRKIAWRKKPVTR